MSDKNKKVLVTRPVTGTHATNITPVAIRERLFPEGPGISAERIITSKILPTGELVNDTLYSMEPIAKDFFVGNFGENPDPHFMVLGGNRVVKNGKTVKYTPGNVDSGFIVTPIQKRRVGGYLNYFK